MVRLPGGAVEQIWNLRRAAEKLKSEGEEPTLEAVASEVGIETKRANMLLAQNGVVSIDAPDDDGLSMGDRLKNDGMMPEEDDSASRRFTCYKITLTTCSTSVRSIFWSITTA